MSARPYRATAQKNHIMKHLTLIAVLMTIGTGALAQDADGGANGQAEKAVPAVDSCADGSGASKSGPSALDRGKGPYYDSENLLNSAE